MRDMKSPCKWNCHDPGKQGQIKNPGRWPVSTDQRDQSTGSCRGLGGAEAFQAARNRVGASIQRPFARNGITLGLECRRPRQNNRMEYGWEFPAAPSRAAIERTVPSASEHREMRDNLRRDIATLDRHSAMDERGLSAQTPPCTKKPVAHIPCMPPGQTCPAGRAMRRWNGNSCVRRFRKLALNQPLKARLRAALLAARDDS